MFVPDHTNFFLKQIKIRCFKMSGPWGSQYLKSVGSDKFMSECLQIRDYAAKFGYQIEIDTSGFYPRVFVVTNVYTTKKQRQ